MTFFARPNLEDLQFKQISGTTLTLSGTTKIRGLNGLQLNNGNGGFIPIAADTFNGLPPTDGMALGYDSVEGRIRLMDISGGTGVDRYLGASPTTITVGGLNENTDIFNTGFTCILEMILVPALDSLLTNPSVSTSTTPSPLQSSYEVGCTISSFIVESTFNGGLIDPTYEENTGQILTPSSPRAGNPTCYVYSGTITGGTVVKTGCTDTLSIPNLVVQQGNNSLTVTVHHESGNIVYDSKGNVQTSALPAGSVNTSRAFTGIYPWFYGTVASGGAPSGSNRPTATAALVSGGTKMTTSSTGTILVNFNSTSDDYIWFAIPQASTSKTRWFIDALNNGNIGGVVSPGGNLFPAEEIVTGVNSPDTPSRWNNQTYKVYISNYQSAATQTMQLRNL